MKTITLLTLTFFVSGMHNGLADLDVAKDTDNSFGDRFDHVTMSNNTKDMPSQHNSEHERRLLSSRGMTNMRRLKAVDKKLVKAIVDNIPTQAPPNKFLSIDVDGQGYDAAIAGMNIAYGTIEWAQDPSISNFGKIVSGLAEMAPMLTVIAPPAGFLVGVAFGAVGSVLQAHGSEHVINNPGDTAAIIDAMDAGFDQVNASVGRVIDITTETLELVRKNNEILEEELRLEFSLFRAINDLYKSAQKEFVQLEPVKNNPDDWAYRLGQFQKELRKAEARKTEFYGVLDGDHFTKSLHQFIKQTKDTGTFCEAGNRVQWYIGTRQQLFWLLSMDAQFNHPDVLDNMMADYTADLKEHMEAYDLAIKEWGSTYLYYAIKVSFTECQAVGIGTNCNHGEWQPGTSTCKCQEPWRKRDGYGDVAEIGNDVSTSKLVVGSLKADCYYRPYSCEYGKDVHLYTGTYSSHYREKVGMFKKEGWFGHHWELRPESQYQDDCGNCDVWRVRSANDGTGRFGLQNRKHEWLKHGGEGERLQQSGGWGNNEKWQFVQVGLSQEPVAYTNGMTNFERIYIKKDDRLAIVRENNMGQVEYKMLTGAWPDYRATFQIVGTDGRKCGPELYMYGQPELLEAPKIQAQKLFVAPTDTTSKTPAFPGEWMLASGRASCAETCALHQRECSEDHWEDAAAEDAVNELFRKLGKTCASFAEVPETDDYANWRPYICVGDACCGDGSCNMACTYTKAVSVQRCQVSIFHDEAKRLCPCLEAPSSATTTQARSPPHLVDVTTTTTVEEARLSAATQLDASAAAAFSLALAYWMS